MNIKMLDAAKVGGLIEIAFKAADKTGEAVHDAAIQCLAHIQQHGNVTLMERLVDGLSERSVNVRGLRFWAGTFAPVTERGGKWGLLKTDSDMYTKYMERNLEAFGDGELGIGDRMFWLDKASETPFWKLDEVKKDNGRNIARLTTATFLGQIIGLEKRLDKAIEKGTFAGDEELAESFIEHMREAAEAWRKEHKSDLRLETAEAALKDAQDEDEQQPDVGGLSTDTIAEPEVAVEDQTAVA